LRTISCFIVKTVLLGVVAGIGKMVLYQNIDQILPNKLHGPMHYKIGATCVNNGHVFYTICNNMTI